MSSTFKGSGARQAPQIKRMKSFGFVGPNGHATWAMFSAEATSVEIAESIAKEAGGQNWPMKIEGQALQDFDFASAKEKIYDITWAPSKDINYYKGQLQKAVDQGAESQHRPSAEPNARTSTTNNGLVEQFTESRAAAVEAEFGQLIISCLDTLEETIDTLVAKKIQLIKEKARIEATIKVLEERIDGFQKKGDQIISSVDAFEQDITKLGGSVEED